MKQTARHPLLDRARETVNRPGTYRMIGADGEVLYVGKSRAVRTRLLTYFRARRGEKALRILEGAVGLEWDYEPSEFGALLRELHLIKRFRPRFNVQHKRDARYSFLKLTGGRAPRLAVAPAVGDDAASYYGPFRGGKRIKEAVRELNDALGLRDCPLNTPMRFADQPDLFAFEHAPRCHRFEMRLCLGPCAGRCSEVEYRERVRMARAFLDGAADDPIRRIQVRMNAAAERWEFEYAAVLRERVARLERLRDEFAELRDALDGLTFLYPVPGQGGEDDRVYVVRRGTVRTVVAAPKTAAERRRLDRLAAEHFGRPEAGGALVPRHQVDEILLLSRWFRARPDELARTVPYAPADGLSRSA